MTTRYNTPSEPSREISLPKYVTLSWRKIHGVGACVVCRSVMTSDVCRTCQRKAEGLKPL